MERDWRFVYIPIMLKLLLVAVSLYIVFLKEQPRKAPIIFIEAEREAGDRRLATSPGTPPPANQHNLRVIIEDEIVSNETQVPPLPMSH